MIRKNYAKQSITLLLILIMLIGLIPGGIFAPVRVSAAAGSIYPAILADGNPTSYQVDSVISVKNTDITSGGVYEISSTISGSALTDYVAAVKTTDPVVIVLNNAVLASAWSPIWLDYGFKRDHFVAGRYNQLGCLFGYCWYFGI